VLLCGSWDTGIARRSDGIWKNTWGGDGQNVRFGKDSDTPGKYAYANFLPYNDGTNTYAITRSSDGGYTWTDIPVHALAAFGMPPPFDVHPTDGTRLIVGADRVWETRSRGDDGWKAVSGPLGWGQIASLIYGGGDVIYASWAGALFFTIDDGANWTDAIHGTDLGGTVVGIAVDPRVAGSVYVVTDSGNVWRGLDWGAQWTNLTGTPGMHALPGAGNVSLALNPPSSGAPPWLFVGTRAGAYVTSDPQDAAPCWTVLGSNLPSVTITDLVFNPTMGVLTAAAYGRGVWQVTLTAAPTCP
jgi:hypothetical protein